MLELQVNLILIFLQTNQVLNLVNQLDLMQITCMLKNKTIQNILCFWNLFFYDGH